MAPILAVRIALVQAAPSLPEAELTGGADDLHQALHVAWHAVEDQRGVALLDAAAYVGQRAQAARVDEGEAAEVDDQFAERADGRNVMVKSGWYR
jgi:hypothetical protein